MRTVLVFALASSLPVPAGAWGATGHQIVADLAARELSPAAREEVRSLLGASMASASTWADEIRNRRPHTRRWHYVDIPLDAAGYEAARDCAGGDCVVAVLERELGILRDPRRSRAARAEALRFVIHFIADLHQPLHSANNDDHGGNDVELRWFRRKSTLHAVWDSDILAELHLSEPQQVRRLARAIGPADRADAAAGTLIDWTNEAHRAAMDVAYPIPRSRQLGETYYRDAAAVVDRQLVRAGLRLARLLNEALGELPGADGSPSLDPATATRSVDPSSTASCIPAAGCCKVCSLGHACGKSCISRSYICHKDRGCACDSAEVCR